MKSVEIIRKMLDEKKKEQVKLEASYLYSQRDVARGWIQALQWVIRGQVGFESVGEIFRDHARPYDVYTSAYNNTECGPMVGFSIAWVEQSVEMGGFGGIEEVYGDDLLRLGTWEDIEKVAEIHAIHINSVVEGVDQVTETITVDFTDETVTAEKLYDEYLEALQYVNAEAGVIWNETHGCPWCDSSGLEELGRISINPDCSRCCGEGMII